MQILDHAHHSPFEKHLYPQCRFCNPKSPLDALEGARKAQQKFDMNNDVQLEIDNGQEFAEKT